MNAKELINLEHYRYLIENRKFNEYDIIGFLVLIREHLDQKINPIFYDIANGTAHRKRNKGRIYDSIYFAILNHYRINNKNQVNGYDGILKEEWDKECLNIGKQFNIKITPIVFKELAICMMSIIHRSEYVTNNKSINKSISIKGSIEIMTECDNISLLTSDDINKITVCFMKVENIIVLKKNSFILEPVETYRKNKFLYLKTKKEDILKVSKKKVIKNV